MGEETLRVPQLIGGSSHSVESDDRGQATGEQATGEQATGEQANGATGKR